MTTAIEEKETMSEMPQVGKIVKESDYGCQILQVKTTLEKANDRSLPTDAKLIWYVVDGIESLISPGAERHQNCLICITISMVQDLCKR